MENKNSKGVLEFYEGNVLFYLGQGERTFVVGMENNTIKFVNIPFFTNYSFKQYRNGEKIWSPK